MNCSTLVFEGTEFDVVDRSGRPWLRAQQIGEALGYTDVKSINRIYTRHADEFTVSMTGVVKVTTSGNLQTEQRIFSLRGAHLLAMLSRTKLAKTFRRWVLDVLDREVAGQNQQRAPVGDGVVILAAGLELFRQELRTLREVAMSVAGTLRPLMGRDGGEVTELFTRSQELPLRWSRLDVGLMSQPVAGRPVGRAVAPPLPAIVETALSDMDVMRSKLEAWSASQPAGAKFTVPQIMLLALGLGEDAATRGDMIRLGKGMRELGWRKVHAAPGSGRYWALQKARY